MFYDLAQLAKVGFVAYFTDISNYADFIYIWGSVANAVL
jgi:hypothetical protein